MQWEVYYSAFFRLPRAASLLRRKAWSEMHFLLFCWSWYDLFFANGSCNRWAKYKITWLTMHCLSSVNWHSKQPPFHTHNHHHIHCYSTTLSFNFFHSFLSDSCQGLLRMKKQNRKRKVVSAEQQPWLAASSGCFCMFKIRRRLLQEQHFYVLQVVLWKHVIKQMTLLSLKTIFHASS